MNMSKPSDDLAPSPSVLVVEDGFLVGKMICEMIRRAGHVPIGPVPSVGEAVAVVRTTPLAGAVLDINIRGGTSEPVAEELERRRVPFFFVSGYASPLLISQRLRVILRLPKPVNEIELKRALETSFRSQRSA